MSKLVYEKVITCLDGKERLFRLYESGNFIYNIWKNGNKFGKTSNLFINKTPNFITKEMLELPEEVKKYLRY